MMPPSIGKVEARIVACAGSPFMRDMSTSLPATKSSCTTLPFSRYGRFENQYLKHCHEIHRGDGRLFLTSTGFDSIFEYTSNGKSSPPDTAFGSADSADPCAEGLWNSGLFLNSVSSIRTDRVGLAQLIPPTSIACASLPGRSS